MQNHHQILSEATVDRSFSEQNCHGFQGLFCWLTMLYRVYEISHLSVGFLGTMPQKMLPWSSHWNGQGFPAIYKYAENKDTHTHIYIYIYICHTGWWYTYPSEKYESQLGVLFPIYGKIKKSKPPTSTHKHTHIYIYISLSLIHIYIYILLYTENLKLRIQAGQLSGSRALLDSLSNGPVSLWPGA